MIVIQYMRFLKIPLVYKNRLITILILSFVIFNFFTSSSNCSVINPSVIYVSNSGNGNFSSIQDAIDTANFGDIIFVLNGTYYENIVIDTPISLIGENKNNTILDGRSTGNVIKINVDDVTIKNFTIQNSGSIFPNAGINSSSNYNTIKNNVLINNFYGITLYKSSNNTITENTIRFNDHCGIYMSKSSTNNIKQNLISNHTYNGIGVYDSSDNNIIQNNSFSNNNFCAVNIRISSDNIISFNVIRNNNIGVHVPNSSNNIENNDFSGNNDDIENELLTPGFSFIIFIVGIILFFYYKKRNNEK